MLKRPLFAATLFAVACSDDSRDGTGGAGGSPPTCMLEYLGDEKADITIELQYSDPAVKKHPLVDGGPLPLVFPPQGGRVAFVGARMTNLDPCGVQISGAIRDQVSKQVRLDGRTINLTPTGDGYGESSETDISTFANIPLCPNQWSDSNIYGTEFQLEFEVTDRQGKKAKVTTTVVPTCAEPDREAECLCQCRGGYILGESCEGGAGGQGGASAGGQGGAGR